LKTKTSLATVCKCLQNIPDHCACQSVFSQLFNYFSALLFLGLVSAGILPTLCAMQICLFT